MGKGLLTRVPKWLTRESEGNSVRIFLVLLWERFWYHRRGKVSVRVFDFGDTYMATASDGETTVWNCYGSTPEQAKEMALWRLQNAKKRPNHVG
jgi:hypothetical protein